MEKIKAAVLDYIRKNDCVTHPEIERIFEQCGFDYKGELMDCSSHCDNVIFWEGWNQAAYDIMQELLLDNLVYRDVASPLVVLTMGKTLGLPLVKKNMTESVTYWELDDLQAVSAIADVGASIDAGNLALFKDDDTIRIARGVNTLTTISAAMGQGAVR